MPANEISVRTIDVHEQIIKSIVQVISNLNVAKAIGICGSSAFGFNRTNSDIDIWICLYKNDIPAFFNYQKVRTLFGIYSNLHLYDCPIKELKEGTIHVMNVKVYISGIKCSFDIYNLDAFAMVCNLYDFKIKRWRQEGISKPLIAFKNCFGREIIAYCEINGWYSSIQNVFIQDELLYYGQHVDRIAASKLLVDDIGVINYVILMWIKILLHAEKYDLDSFVNFMYRSDKIPQEIKSTFNKNIFHFRRNIRIWKESLKSMGMTT